MVKFKILYFFIMTASSLYFRSPLLMFLFFIINVTVWVAVHISIDELFISFKRYIPFFFFIAVSYAILGDFDEDFLIGDSLKIGISTGGILSGIGMSLKVYNIVLASLIVRKAGSPDDLYKALRAIRVPESVVESMGRSFFNARKIVIERNPSIEEF